MQEAAVERHVEELQRSGYLIVEDAIELDLVDEFGETIRRIQVETDAKPRNPHAGGWATLRLYNLLAKGKVFQKMPVHPAVLPLVEGVLDPECLLSGMTAIDIGPSEKAQMIHADDLNIGILEPFRKEVMERFI